MTKNNKENSAHKKWSYGQFFGMVVTFYIVMNLFGDYEPLRQFDLWYFTWLYEMLMLLGAAFIFWLPFKVFSDIREILQTGKNKRRKEFKALIIRYFKSLVMGISLAFSIAMTLGAILDFQLSLFSSIIILIVGIATVLFVYYLLYKCKYKWLKKKFAT